MRHSDKSTNHKPQSKRSRDMSFRQTAVGSTTITLVALVVITLAALATISIGSQSNKSTTTTTTTTGQGTTLTRVTTQDQPCLSSQGKQVQWNVAVSAILSSQVTCVTQSHHLDVTLSFRNGSRWVTSEPAIDEVFHVVSQCGSPCANITRVTE